MNEGLDEAKITRLILEDFSEKFSKCTEVNVGIVGAGPAGMTAGRYLAEDGYDVVIFERKLNVGGGMWGGGMTFPSAIIQPEAADIVKEYDIKLKEKNGFFIADAVELPAKVAAKTVDAGAVILNNITVNDVLIRENDVVKGLVVNWASVLKSGLHVDPLSIKSDVVIDATGHNCEVLNIIKEKIPDAKLETEGTDDERPMWAEKGEKAIVENTKEVYPGVIVAGMAANAAFRGPRMGPVFGGMFLSGKRAAEVAEKIL